MLSSVRYLFSPLPSPPAFAILAELAKERERCQGSRILWPRCVSSLPSICLQLCTRVPIFSVIHQENVSLVINQWETSFLVSCVVWSVQNKSRGSSFLRWLTDRFKNDAIVCFVTVTTKLDMRTIPKKMYTLTRECIWTLIVECYYVHIVCAI